MPESFERYARLATRALADEPPGEQEALWILDGDDLERTVGDLDCAGKRLLIRTDYVNRRWGAPDFWDKPPYLTPSAAAWMIERKVCLMGLDCLTERPGDRASPVHIALLERDIPIVEYLRNMGQLSSREVFLIALPLLIEGVEATAARVTDLSVVSLGSTLTASMNFHDMPKGAWVAFVVAYLPDGQDDWAETAGHSILAVTFPVPGCTTTPNAWSAPSATTSPPGSGATPSTGASDGTTDRAVCPVAASNTLTADWP